MSAVSKNNFITTNKEQIHIFRFATNISHIVLPKKFTYPFCYEAHEITKIAAKELEHYITKIKQAFDIDQNSEFNNGIGKMFGVLVVCDENSELGYLAAFSGKLYESNFIKGFVPPIFDTLESDGYYKIGEAEINKINSAIEALEKNPTYLKLHENKEDILSKGLQAIEDLKNNIAHNKKIRKQKRLDARTTLNDDDYQVLIKNLEIESIKEHYKLKDYRNNLKIQIEEIDAEIESINMKILALKKMRKEKSSNLQAWLFENYKFLNAHKELKSLKDIFDISDNVLPPSGAGECAAPKLLQAAYIHSLQVICMAEFWYGPSPASEIRKHGVFYPSCISKCKPILGHMMKGLTVEDNPIYDFSKIEKKINLLYEDDDIIVLEKPEEFLSVPGKEVRDSVYQRLQTLNPTHNIMVVHRLDMSTSGVMVFAKNKNSHKRLQYQFIHHKIQKTYMALLNGTINLECGTIDLPIRVDLDNRPYQMVCDQYGKKAVTHFKVLNVEQDVTRILFYPATGRTHQLRVHSAHCRGLNVPILGDDLYGTKLDRLYLHALEITFMHPTTNEICTFRSQCPF